MNSIYFQIIGKKKGKKKQQQHAERQSNSNPFQVNQHLFMYCIMVSVVRKQVLHVLGAGLSLISWVNSRCLPLKMISLLYVSSYMSFIARDWWPSFFRADSLAIGWITLPNLNLWYTCIIESRHLNYYDPLYIFIFHPQILRILKKLKIHIH